MSRIMSEEEYTSAQAMLSSMAQLIADLPLDVIYNKIERAETLGPILDPTLYRNASPQLAEYKKLVQAALPFWREARRQIAEEKKNG